MATPTRLTLGPGTLTLGSTSQTLDLAVRVTAAKISAKADTEDPIMLLSGENEPGTRTYTWTLAVTALQDIETNGLIDYTWKNKGQAVQFTFAPTTTSAGTKVTGKVIIDPADLGGDVGKKNTSDLELEILGEPVLTIGGAAA